MLLTKSKPKSHKQNEDKMSKQIHRNCGHCVFWSELIAKTDENMNVLAMCESQTSEYSGKYKKAFESCSEFEPAFPSHEGDMYAPENIDSH